MRTSGPVAPATTLTPDTCPRAAGVLSECVARRTGWALMPITGVLALIDDARKGGGDQRYG